jgi:hypothetical protein
MLRTLTKFGVPMFWLPKLALPAVGDLLYGAGGHLAYKQGGHLAYCTQPVDCCVDFWNNTNQIYLTIGGHWTNAACQQCDQIGGTYTLTKFMYYSQYAYGISLSQCYQLGMIFTNIIAMCGGWQVYLEIRNVGPYPPIITDSAQWYNPNRYSPCLPTSGITLDTFAASYHDPVWGQCTGSLSSTVTLHM